MLLSKLTLDFDQNVFWMVQLKSSTCICFYLADVKLFTWHCKFYTQEWFCGLQACCYFSVSTNLLSFALYFVFHNRTKATQESPVWYLFNIRLMWGQWCPAMQSHLQKHQIYCICCEVFNCFDLIGQCFAVLWNVKYSKLVMLLVTSRWSRGYWEPEREL